MKVHHARASSGLPACLLTVAAAFAVAACGDKSSDAAALANAKVKTGAAASAAPTAKPAKKAPADGGEKLNIYVKCFNSTHERAHKAMERYASWVKNMETGPTGKERVVYGLYTLSESNLKDCNQPVLDAVAATPAMPALDSAAKAYSSAVLAWGKTLEEAYPYYSRENYKDDAMAGGKAMHGGIATSYAAFSAASKLYNKALEEANDQRQLTELAEIEKSQGRKFNYWHVATMLSAKQLVNLMEQEDFDVAVATERLKAFEDTADSLIAASSQPDAAKAHYWSSMSSQLEDYRKTAKGRLRHVRDKMSYSQGDRMMLNANSGWMVQGSPDKLIKSYNELIGSSNRMR